MEDFKVTETRLAYFSLVIWGNSLELHFYVLQKLILSKKHFMSSLSKYWRILRNNSLVKRRKKNNTLFSDDQTH